MDSKRALQVEKEVAKVLGFSRVSFSGAKWDNKEDLREEISADCENVGVFLGQVKATDSTAIKITMKALNELVLNSKKYHKRPVIIFHFDRKDIVRPTWCAVPIGLFLKMKTVYEKHKGVK